MRYRSLFVVAVSLASCGEAVAPAPRGAVAKEASNLLLDAKGIPQFRPGLWELVRTDSSGDGGPERERQCLGEEANAELTKLLTATGTPACTVSRARRAGRYLRDFRLPAGRRQDEDLAGPDWLRNRLQDEAIDGGCFARWRARRRGGHGRRSA